LFVRRPLIEQLEPPFIDLHAATWIDKDQFEIRNDARRFENWESYIAGRIGLATAVDYALDIGLMAIQERVQYLAALLRNRLSDLAGVVVRDLGQHRCGIVTFTNENESASAIKQRLASHKINISVTDARYARLDLVSRGINELARASIHYFNTEAEIDRFCTILSQ
ncbi:MAG: aminotransferase class V-fold PLP-dependent enzyme, partial [Desulfobacterales bacterium]|nr:aminotransferase class V-fold PLP-dependent enzyme [Desulfobacterales bacterium]